MGTQNKINNRSAKAKLAKNIRYYNLDHNYEFYKTISLKKTNYQILPKNIFGTLFILRK